jgi:hypothetical protein
MKYLFWHPEQPAMLIFEPFQPGRTAFKLHT